MLHLNPHLQTLVPALLRPIPGFKYQRQAIDTPDEDFLDLDWYITQPSKNKLAIVLHGLEGTSESSYVKNAILRLNEEGYDAVAMNFRGCSGRPNKLLKSYHSGKTEDLDLVVNHILRNYKYDEIVLVGFSVGGNIVLKYLGEKATGLHPKIKKAVAFSAPVDLKSSADALAKGTPIYMKYLLEKLHRKLVIKREKFPEEVDLKDFSRITTFHEFDDRYTAPLNGFRDAEDYWQQASSKTLLDRIAIPTLLFTAEDDPFLGKECYPKEAVAANPNFQLQVTPYGGHVGFWNFKFKGLLPRINFYHEQEMLKFLD